MSIFVYIAVLLYVVIAGIVNVAMVNEWQNDPEKNLRPSFMRLSMFCCSALWPVTFIAAYFMSKKEKN